MYQDNVEKYGVEDMNVVTSFEYVETMLCGVLEVVPFEAKDKQGRMQPERVQSLSCAPNPKFPMEIMA